MSVQSDRVPEVYDKVITAEYKALLQKALLKECKRILQEVPPEREYHYWDVYVGKAGLSLLFYRIHELVS